MGITDVNFISFSAAYLPLYNAETQVSIQSTKEKKKIDIRPSSSPLLVGCINPIAIKTIEGTYDIIAEPHPTKWKNFYLTEHDYVMSNPETKTRTDFFFPWMSIFRLYLDTTLPKGTKILTPIGHDVFRCEDGTKVTILHSEPISSFVGQTTKMPNEVSKFYASAYNYRAETGMDEALQIWFYENDANYTPYYGNLPIDEQISYYEQKKLCDGKTSMEELQRQKALEEQRRRDEERQRQKALEEQRRQDAERERQRQIAEEQQSRLE